MQRVYASILFAVVLFCAPLITAHNAQAAGGTVNFTKLESNGFWDHRNNMGDVTSRLDIVLNPKFPLMSKDIQITPADACEVVLPQSSDGSMTNWTISIKGVSRSQEITVTLKRDGYTFNPPSRKVVLYSGKEAAAGVAQPGISSAAQAALGKIYNIPDDKIKDGASLPQMAKKGIGALDRVKVMTSSGAKILFFYFNNVSADDFAALAHFYESNGGQYYGEDNSDDVVHLRFDWGTLQAVYYGEGKMQVEAVVKK